MSLRPTLALLALVSLPLMVREGEKYLGGGARKIEI